jgi:hypothetical protein
MIRRATPAPSQKQRCKAENDQGQRDAATLPISAVHASMLPLSRSRAEGQRRDYSLERGLYAAPEMSELRPLLKL